jgi:AraC-like DNA-binding protein
MPATALEFTLATIFGRLRYVTQEAFRPLAVGLPATMPPDDPVRQRLWQAPISYGHSCASFSMTHAMWEREIPGADPYLHAVLQRMAPQLHLANHQANDLEQALRIRLRDALADGSATPARLARLLGISVRTLQRRLSETGRSFSAVVEDFRREEALRLLQDPRAHIVQIAGRLGYAEQTSFTRAFRRWTGDTPGAWRAQRSHGATDAVVPPSD